MKSVVRNEVLQKIRSLSREEKQRQSLGIQEKLKQVFAEQNGTWGAYQNLGDEPALQWSEISSTIDWAFPQLQPQGLDFVRSVQTFQKSSYGFMQPADGESVALNEIRGFVIPAIAYDKQGVRLGRGKGHYDRALQDYAGLKIGVCFNVSLCEQLPHEAHDIQCDLVVTEDHVYQSGQTFEGAGKWN